VFGDLSNFKNLHAGKKCFVVGAGPSAVFLDFSSVHSYPVICVNSSILLMPWKQDGDLSLRFWMSTDVLCQHWSYFSECVLSGICNRIVKNSWKQYTSKWPEVMFYYYSPFNEKTGEGLLSNSSILSALDFAILMGCKNIYLLGVDHRMIQGKSHFWQFWDKHKQPTRNGKPGNFYPDQRQQKRIFELNMPLFEKLKEKATKAESTIYNCSSLSEIKCFPLISLEDAVS